MIHEGMGRAHAKFLKDNKIMLELIFTLGKAKDEKWKKSLFKLPLPVLRQEHSTVCKYLCNKDLCCPLLVLVPGNSSKYCHLKKT